MFPGAAVPFCSNTRLVTVTAPDPPPATNAARVLVIQFVDTAADDKASDTSAVSRSSANKLKSTIRLPNPIVFSLTSKPSAPIRSAKRAAFNCR